jgi:hypothetical protein
VGTISRRPNKCQKYEFTLILGRKPRLTTRVANALYEAGCDDATLSSCDGIVSADFHRESDSCRNAMVSAIADVEGSGVGARVERIEPYEGQHTELIAALNLLLELRRTVQKRAEAVELVGALTPVWS